MSTPPTVLNIGYGRHLFHEGNPERARLARCAGATSHLHAIIFSRASDELEAEDVTEHFTLYPTNSRSKLSLLINAYQLACAIVEQHEGELIVHTQDPFETGVIGYLVKKKYPSKVRLVVQEHGDVFSLPYWRQESFLNRLRYVAGLDILRRADRVRVVSKRIAHTLRSFGVKTPIVQLPVAIDTTPFSALPPRESRGASSTFTFLSVARFVPQKNFPLMLRAFADVHALQPHTRLHVVGSGPEEQSIRALVKALFPDGECPVQIDAWSDSVPTLMQSADAYLLTSNYEGWGRVLIESLCAGLPIVTTDVGCAGEVVKHEEHGLIVPVNDTPALVSAMTRIVTDTDVYHRITHNLSQLHPRDIPGTDVEQYGEMWVASLGEPQQSDI